MNQWSSALERYATTAAQQSGRLIATLATSGGARRRLDWLMDHFFVAAVDRLEERGVPRRVAADMLGTTHRTLQRRYAAATQSAEVRGRSAWISIVELLRNGPLSREELTGHMRRVRPLILGSILNDMNDSGWIEERDGAIYLTIDPHSPVTQEALRLYVEVQRRADPHATADEVAQAVGVDAERIRSIWDMSDQLMVSADGESRWLAMERCAAMVLELLSGTADDVESGRYGAAIWRVRLDDKSPEFRRTLRNTLRRLNDEVAALLEPHAVQDNELEDGRFWELSMFQTAVLPEEESGESDAQDVRLELPARVGSTSC